MSRRTHRSDELITPARHGDDIPRSVGIVAERTPQRENGLTEVVVFNDRRRPKRLGERGARYDLPRALDDADQGIEGLRVDGHDRAVAANRDRCAGSSTKSPNS